MKSMAGKAPNVVALEHKRDAYGFPVRPQHVQRYREYANIYKVEEEERSDRWKMFLEQISVSVESQNDGVNENGTCDEGISRELDVDLSRQLLENHSDKGVNGDLLEAGVHNHYGSNDNVQGNMEAPTVGKKKIHRIQIWSDIRPSLHPIENMMCARVKTCKVPEKGLENGSDTLIFSGEEAKHAKGVSEEDSEDEFYDVERSDPLQDNSTSVDSVRSPTMSGIGHGAPTEYIFPWKEELEVLVRGGVPMALRGELWQAFVGVKVRRIESYYEKLLSPDTTHSDTTVNLDTDHKVKKENAGLHEKWKGQIEKDLPRTFPGHPALDEDGRNALRRLLIAYARHNPTVGYCQAMNFLAGLLLLLMPEENAFWTLMGIMDDYFDGYYSEEMIESQVDQLVFEELVRERFPKLINHLDYLGVQVAWITGPWFLSIFTNLLPWESVFRVWDVLLFEGNRVMLFRTALALMDLYGPALVTTKDAGDAVTLLQSLACSTFDSSQLVLTACMGYRNVNETSLLGLREKHRPTVVAAIEERSKGFQLWKNSQGLASRLYSFKHDPGSMILEESKWKGQTEVVNGDIDHLDNGPTSPDDIFVSLKGGVNVDPGCDLQKQVMWLKVGLCTLLEEKRSAELRSEELETALMEMVKQDNRRQLHAWVEQLEQELSELRCALADKQEQERVMLEVLMRVEQEQKVTEDARIYAEQEATAQRYAAQLLQEKYEQCMASLDEMEKRAVMAESILEATLQYQSGQHKSLSSPRNSLNGSSQLRNSQEISSDQPARKVSLLARPFGLGWRDRNKGNPSSADGEVSDAKPADEVQKRIVIQQQNVNGHQQADAKQ
ncbi:TBC1 domain family member 8B-like protein [Drosera capensis]